MPTPGIDMEQLDWRDVTEPIRPELTVWPGDQSFTARPSARIARGDTANVSTIALSTHTGTHCDAPWHFLDDGKRVHELDPTLFIGPAQVLDCRGVKQIDADDLGPGPFPKRVLIKTDNADIPLTAPFKEDFAALTVDAAERLTEAGVGLVGIDYFSVAPFPDQSPVHHVLLGAEVLIVENLRLAPIPPGPSALIVMPMLLQGMDGAPCRAFVGLART